MKCSSNLVGGNPNNLVSLIGPGHNSLSPHQNIRGIRKSSASGPMAKSSRLAAFLIRKTSQNLLICLNASSMVTPLNNSPSYLFVTLGRNADDLDQVRDTVPLE